MSVPMIASLAPISAVVDAFKAEHWYWHRLYGEHLKLSPVTLCGCEDGGRLCSDGQRFNDEADDAGKRWKRAEGRE